MNRSRELTARDIMTRELVTVTVDTSLLEASRLILGHDVSGLLVVGVRGELRGILSEYDCLRALAVGEYHGERHRQVARVGDAMTIPKFTVSPERGVYSLADILIKNRIRRLPVVEEGVLVGLVSRRDVLEGILRKRKRDLTDKSPGPRTAEGQGLFISATGAKRPEAEPLAKPQRPRREG